MKVEDHKELTEIYEQMQDLVRSAERIMMHEGGTIYERARGYWLASFKTALSNNHSYIGGCMFTMQDALDHILIDGEDTNDNSDEDEAEYDDASDEDDDDDLLPQD